MNGGTILRMNQAWRGFFHWQYSGVLIIAFHAFALAFWGIALATTPYEPLFGAAALCLVLGTIWSLGWWWSFEFLERRRDRRAAYLAWAISISLLFVAAPALVGYLMWQSRDARIAAERPPLPNNPVQAPAKTPPPYQTQSLPKAKGAAGVSFTQEARGVTQGTGNPGVDVYVTAEGTLRHSTFLVKCDRPCSYRSGSGISTAYKVTVEYSPDESETSLRLDVPSVLKDGEQLLFQLQSNDIKTVKVLSVRLIAKPDELPDKGDTPHRVSSPRHTFNADEQGKFEALLSHPSDPKTVVRLSCPMADEAVCIYAVQFIDIFKSAGWTVDGGIVERVTLLVPYAGTRQFCHSDAPFDPMQKPGTGHWLAVTPDSISIQKAFISMGIGTDRGGEADIPSDMINIYFGPEEGAGEADASLQRSMAEIARYKQATSQIPKNQ
jgi:hypothetical protein